MHIFDPLSTDYQLVKLNDASTALDGSITPALEPVVKPNPEIVAMAREGLICLSRTKHEREQGVR